MEKWCVQINKPFHLKKGLDLVPIIFAVLPLFHPTFERLPTPYSLVFLLIAHGGTSNKRIDLPSINTLWYPLIQFAVKVMNHHLTSRLVTIRNEAMR